MANPVPTPHVDNAMVNRGGTLVVKDVSFDLCETDLALLSGPSGAGKSTFLWVIVYLLPFAGNITISGHHPASLEALLRKMPVTGFNAICS